jgi:long-chain acyl-CoA synthetase
MSITRGMMLGFAQPLLPEIFETHGATRPRDRAVVAHDGTLDWAGLISRTNRFANGLAAAGLEGGARIGLLMSNGVATVEAMIGALRGGYVFVPINLSVTDDAIPAMLADAGATALVVTADQLDRVAHLDIGLKLVVRAEAAPGWQDYSAWMECQSDLRPNVPIDADTLAMIIYSSGTTGAPKGITHDHGSRVAWAIDLAAALRYHSSSRTMVATGLFSNISWLGVSCTLLVGGTVFVPSRFDALDFMCWAERERLTHVAMVPVQYQRIVEHPEFARFDLNSFQSMTSIGSKLAPALKARLLEIFPGKLFDAYGLTEGVATALDPELASDRIASSGRPTLGSRLAVLRDDDSIGDVGESGEVIGLSRYAMVGYWNQPEATQEATWIGPDGRRWLRTGDIGQINADGFLTIVDRKKDLILSGGQNIYPADIEAVLLAHPYVSECAVIGIPSEKWGETPLALIVPRGTLADADELREWVNARVGKRQRIDSVAFRETLPRNPAGKVLKRVLRLEFWA